MGHQASAFSFREPRPGGFRFAGVVRDRLRNDLVRLKDKGIPVFHINLSMPTRRSRPRASDPSGKKMFHPFLGFSA